MTETTENASTVLAALTERCTALELWADTLVVDSPEVLQKAEANLVELANFGKQVEAFFRPNIDAAHKAHKTALAQLQVFTVPLGRCKEIARRKAINYRDECERERQRKAAELRERARQEEEARIIAEAEQLEREGHKEAADEVIQRPVNTPPIAVAATVPSATGMRYRKVYKGYVVKKSILPEEYWEPDMKKINAHGRSLGAQAKIDGVEFRLETL